MMRREGLVLRLPFLRLQNGLGKQKICSFCLRGLERFGDDDERAPFVGLAFIFVLRTVFLLIIMIGETTLAMAIKS